MMVREHGGFGAGLGGMNLRVTACWKARRRQQKGQHHEQAKAAAVECCGLRT